MGTLLESPLVSPTLVGRDAHLEALTRVLDDTSKENGSTILISGEAGVGKSRLVGELHALAAQAGFRCLQGNCYEHDVPLPFEPIVGLMQEIMATGSPEETARALAGSAPELAGLLPELTGLAPDVTSIGGHRQEHQRLRLFHAFGRLVVELSNETPILVVVEDLHWIDDASMEAVAHLARRVRGRPILLALTFRDDTDADLRHWLAALDRQRLTHELRLSRLSLDETGAMMQAILEGDQPPRADFVRAIYALTEGNPFFVEEMLKALTTSVQLDLDDNAPWQQPVAIASLNIPRSIRDAVQRRVDRLSGTARQVLVAAAVIGRRFDFVLLQAVTGCDEQTLLPPLKELIAAQLIVELMDEQFAFRHALTRRVIYSELLARERRALHQTVAQALERLHGDALQRYLEDLAAHYFEAQRWDKALEYAGNAGDRAEALHAPQAAAQQFTRALTAAYELGLDASPDLHRKRGLAHAILGDFDQALADLEITLGLSRNAGDRLAEWRALIDLGQLWSSRDYGRAGANYREALVLAREIDQPLILAHSQNWLGNWYLNRGQPLECQQYHAQALAIFERQDDRRGIGETHDLLGLANNMIGDLEQSVVHYRQAIPILRELDDSQRLASSLAVLATRGMGYVTDTLVWTATTPDEPIREAESACRLAGEIDWRAGEAYAFAALADCLATQGEFGRALGHAANALALADELGHIEWMTAVRCSLGMLDRELLEPAGMETHLEQALQLAREVGSQWISIASGLLASACVWKGDLSQAAAVLDSVAGDDDAVQMLGQRVCRLAAAELACARGRHDVALDLANQLIASIPGSTVPRPAPRLLHLQATALAGMGEWAQAERLLRDAELAAREQGRRPLLWRIHVSRADLHHSQRQVRAAEQARSGAWKIVRELAVSLPDTKQAEAFLERAGDVIAPGRRLTERDAAKLAFGGLTARERQVAALIARGKTNREIAADLFLSERTVEGHVTNTLAKLDFSSRVQLAAWAIEMGLV